LVTSTLAWVTHLNRAHH